MEKMKFKTVAIACATLFALQASAQVRANKLVLLAETSAVTHVYAQACKNTEIMLKKMDRNVLQYVNDNHPGEGEIYVTYYNTGLVIARKNVELKPPSLTQCFGEISIDFAKMTLDAEAVGALIDQKQLQRSQWNPEKGGNVCREVVGTYQNSGRTSKVAYRIRGFVEDIYTDKIRVMISNIMTPDPYPARKIVDWISITELAPLYSKGAAVSELKSEWYPCETL